MSAAAGLQPPARVDRVQPGTRPESRPLVLVDTIDRGLKPSRLHERFGPDAPLVALIEGLRGELLGETLSGDWFDYLFLPLNRGELRLVWRRHHEGTDSAPLTLDVDERGGIGLTFPAEVRFQRPAVERVVEACRHLGALDPDATFRLRVALGEAVANAILYGSGDDPSLTVQIRAVATPEQVSVTVADRGSGFDPQSVPDPTESSALGRTQGRGLHMMRSLVDEVTHNEAGNEVTLRLGRSRGVLDSSGPLFNAYARLTGLRYRVRRTDREQRDTIYDGLDGEAGTSPFELGSSDQPSVELTYGTSFDSAPVREEQVYGFLELLARSLARAERATEREIAGRLRRERVLAEIEVARDLQLRMMPAPETVADLARVAARCDPALSLGGDFYYLARLEGGRLGVMIGDVSSHGPSAALIMTLTLSLAGLAAHRDAGPGAVLDAIGAQLAATLASTEMYMTLFYTVWDPAARSLMYANAGHPYAFLHGPAGLERLGALDPPLGMADPGAFREAEARPAAGSWLLALTDGIAEQFSGTRPVDDEIARMAGAAAAPEALIQALFAASDARERLDDRTAVAVELA